MYNNRSVLFASPSLAFSLSKGFVVYVENLSKNELRGRLRYKCIQFSERSSGSQTEVLIPLVGARGLFRWNASSFHLMSKFKVSYLWGLLLLLSQIRNLIIIFIPLVVTCYPRLFHPNNCCFEQIYWTCCPCLLRSPKVKIVGLRRDMTSDTLERGSCHLVETKQFNHSHSSFVKIICLFCWLPTK